MDSITSVRLPSGLSTISRSTFSGCNILSSVVIPKGVTIIEFYCNYSNHSKDLVMYGVYGSYANTFADSKGIPFNEGSKPEEADPGEEPGEEEPEDKPEEKPTAGFKDAAPGAFYAKAVDWAVKKGITKGTGPITFSPAKTCNRGEIVTFLYRHMGDE